MSLEIQTFDIRFPTSRDLDGSDAMNPDPDYSAAYVVVRDADAPDTSGHGFVFTNGRGTSVQVAAIEAIAATLQPYAVDDLLADMGRTWKLAGSDSQLRWLGPNAGIIHMAHGAVINALWDLKAKRAGLPLWDLLSQMSPDELINLIDFRYLLDFLTPAEARQLLVQGVAGREAARARLLAQGYPAYTTTPGWLGYTDDKLVRLSAEAVAAGFTQIKLKVGRSLTDDQRRLKLARAEVGDQVKIAVDANQIWSVPEAIDWVSQLAQFDLDWVEEPTSPDDILGHAAIAKAIAPIPVATGEHVANPVIFKQMLAAGSLSVLQLDATRVAGVNENLAILLMAAKAGVRVCPHAGGVGLCELVQHYSMFDYVALSQTTAGRVIEYVDHLHQHFVTPVVIQDGKYAAPTAPGAGGEMKPESLRQYRYQGN